MAEAAEIQLAERRMLVVVNTAGQASARTQFENLCRAQNVRCRIGGEVGRRSTALVLDLRGPREGVAAATAQIEAFLAAQTLAPAAPGLSRITIGTISFLLGLAGTLVLFMLASQGGPR